MGAAREGTRKGAGISTESKGLATGGGAALLGAGAGGFSLCAVDVVPEAPSRAQHSTAHRTTPHSTALLAVALLTLPPSAAEMARGMAAMLASAQPYWRAVVSS